MEEIAVSKFKATCLAVLEEVRKTRKPVRVTRFGKPVAEIIPPAPAKKNGSWLGAMEGTVLYMGDIVSPALSEDEWFPKKRRTKPRTKPGIEPAIEHRRAAK